MGDDRPVMVQHRDLPFGIDRHEPVGMLFELVQIDIVALISEPLFLEGNHRFERIGQRLGVVIFQGHCGILLFP